MMMAIYCHYSYLSIRHYKIDLEVCQSRINMYQLESIEQEKRINEAKKQAELQVAKMQEQTKRILAANVSKDCNQAMAWGISEARSFQ